MGNESQEKNHEKKVSGRNGEATNGMRRHEYFLPQVPSITTNAGIPVVYKLSVLTVSKSSNTLSTVPYHSRTAWPSPSRSVKYGQGREQPMQRSIVIR